MAAQHTKPFHTHHVWISTLALGDGRGRFSYAHLTHNKHRCRDRVGAGAEGFVFLAQ